MEIISMSKNKFDKLKPIILPNNVCNTECDLFHYRYRNKEKALKKLYLTGGNNFGNKLYTIEALSSNSELIPDNFVMPESWVAINKKIEAFVMPFVKGTNLSVVLDDTCISYEDKICYLKMIGEILEHMANTRKFTSLKDFYIGDLHEDNFVVDTINKKLYVVDVDSVKIADNLSFPARYLSRNGLLSNVGKKYKINDNAHSIANYSIDENTDLYCYVIMILNYLYGEKINNISMCEFYNYLNYLDSLNFDVNLLHSFERIVSNGNNVNPLPYLEGITPRQIGMSRKKVYQLRK